jgi:hypothetical protein
LLSSLCHSEPLFRAKSLRDASNVIALFEVLLKESWQKRQDRASKIDTLGEILRPKEGLRMTELDILEFPTIGSLK